MTQDFFGISGILWLPFVLVLSVILYRLVVSSGGYFDKQYIFKLMVRHILILVGTFIIMILTEHAITDKTYITIAGLLGSIAMIFVEKQFEDNISATIRIKDEFQKKLDIHIDSVKQSIDQSERYFRSTQESNQKDLLDIKNEIASLKKNNSEYKSEIDKYSNTLKELQSKDFQRESREKIIVEHIQKFEDAILSNIREISELKTFGNKIIQWIATIEQKLDTGKFLEDKLIQEITEKLTIKSKVDPKTLSGIGL